MTTPARMTEAHRRLLERFWAGSDYMEVRRWDRRMRRARVLATVKHGARLQGKAAA